MSDSSSTPGPNKVTSGKETIFHPTSAAAVSAVMAALTAFQAASPHPTSWVEYVTGAVAAVSAAWAVLAPKASAS